MPLGQSRHQELHYWMLLLNLVVPESVRTTDDNDDNNIKNDIENAFRYSSIVISTKIT